mgnify:CR=1 FL=1
MIKSMNMRIGIFVSFIALFLFLVGIGTIQAAPALDCGKYCAADPPGSLEFPTGKTCICNPLQSTSFTGVVDKILNILFFIAIAIAPVMIIMAGFGLLTGGGNPENVTKARQMLVWTAVGFGIILLSKGIVMILRNIIGF